MKNQATINIGIIGHVAHGKSSIVKAISGIHTVRFKNEMIRNITIKLGYASAKIFKCDDPKCPRPKNYKSTSSNVEKEICHCGSTMTLKKHVSFVDCPGHEILMSTMLSGTSIMDAALLTIAANESCPQPQTSEHLAAIEIMGLDNIMILQNKIDLVKETDAACQYEEIKIFVKGTRASDSPIIPICAQAGYNIDVICEYIVNKIPEPIRDLSSPVKMTIIRSFDVNKPGDITIENLNKIHGGVVGGSLVNGILKIGDEIEIRPGIMLKDEDGNNKCIPIISKVVSLFSETNNIEYAIPGGLIGVGTKIDPSLTKGDRLVGQVLGLVGTLPDVYEKIEIEFYLMTKVLGVKNEHRDIENLKVGETLTINISSTSTGGRILSISKTKTNVARLSLSIPICAMIGDKVAISRRIGGKWRLIGWGKILKGLKI